MCHRITCDTCGKPTWEGCGEHIEQALSGVPIAERCHCKQFEGTDDAGAAVSSW